MIVNCIVFPVNYWFRNTQVLHVSMVITLRTLQYDTKHLYLITQRNNQILSNPRCNQIASKLIRHNSVMSLTEPNKWCVLNKRDNYIIWERCHDSTCMVSINKERNTQRPNTWLRHIWRWFFLNISLKFHLIHIIIKHQQINIWTRRIITDAPHIHMNLVIKNMV